MFLMHHVSIADEVRRYPISWFPAKQVDLPFLRMCFSRNSL